MTTELRRIGDHIVSYDPKTGTITNPWSSGFNPADLPKAVDLRPCHAPPPPGMRDSWGPAWGYGPGGRMLTTYTPLETYTMQDEEQSGQAPGVMGKRENSNRDGTKHEGKTDKLAQEARDAVTGNVEGTDDELQAAKNHVNMALMRLFNAYGEGAVLTKTVEIEEGGTLWSLAEKHVGNGQHWRILYMLNLQEVHGTAEEKGLAGDPNLIFPGKTLRIFA